MAAAQAEVSGVVTAARTRVRRWKPHGAKFWVTAIHESDQNSVRAAVLTRVRENILWFGDRRIAGFAMVVWDEDQTWIADLENFNGKIPLALIPDYVRNCLLAQQIEEWTPQAIRSD